MVGTSQLHSTAPAKCPIRPTPETRPPRRGVSVVATLATVWAGTVLIGTMLIVPADAGAGEPVSLVELQREIRQTLREEARANTLVERAAAIYELCALHREIVRDPRFGQLELLQEMRREVASRLVRIQADLKRRLHRERTDKNRTDPHDEWTAVIAEHWSLVGSLQGGPAELLSQQPWSGGGLAAGGGVVPDNGQGLVDLIQRTIHPDFWDVQGGPGTIVYFSPLRCLVVRATDEVHGDVGGLVRGLRAANP